MSHVVGEVTYVELFKDAEGKSRVSAVEAGNSASSLMCSTVTGTHSSLFAGFMSDLLLMKSLPLGHGFVLTFLAPHYHIYMAGLFNWWIPFLA